MEDQVPFKVFTYWHEGDQKPEVRRFGVDKNVITNYIYLNAKIQEIFPRLKEKTFYICWKDDEDDEVKISSDEEIMTMLTASRDSIVKLYVFCEGDAKPESVAGIEVQAPVNASNDAVVYIDVLPTSSVASAVSSLRSGSHLGVCCDSCGCRVVGFRYKCITCDDYDLCGQCESTKAHPEHCVVRIPSPQMSLQVIKDSIKKSRHFLKSVASNIHDEHKKQMSSQASATCSAKAAHKEEMKKARQEKREERQERREERKEERREERRERRECHRGQPRRRWMDVFAKYVDEFANLAGDFNRTAGAAGSSTENEASSCPLAQQACGGTQSIDFPTLLNSFLSETPDCPGNLGQEIKKHIEKVLEGGEGNAEAPEQSTSQASVSTQAPTEEKKAEGDSQTDDAQAQLNKITQALNAALIDAQQTASQTPVSSETPKAPITPSVTPVVADEPKSVESTDSARDGFAEKADDWTLINKDKDLDSDNDATTSAPVENLPEEFQRTPVSQLYPPLNTATAVEEPSKPAASAQANVEATSKPQPTATAPPQTPTEPKTAPGPSRHHLAPHIDAAVHQMLTMGFTNEGGWLSQLLESKDGNIAAVLDLLTPVNPNRN